MHSPLAVVHPEAQIGKNVTVEPFAFIEKDVVIGDNCRIYPHAVVLEGSRIGKGCHISHLVEDDAGKDQEEDTTQIGRAS